MERLGNEMTRMSTLKALAAVSVSPLKVDLQPILPSATEELALFLRQQSRPLKQTTLETLLALIGRWVLLMLLLLLAVFRGVCLFCVFKAQNKCCIYTNYESVVRRDEGAG